MGRKKDTKQSASFRGQILAAAEDSDWELEAGAVATKLAVPMHHHNITYYQVTGLLFDQYATFPV